ncbi:MAG: hypothetical protein E3J52_00485 [Promethearchaeota archaeon]|nr:MAG: hypothetical protein E3J52_00485 [Candidatus Lokiarchaeota archaeon]
MDYSVQSNYILEDIINILENFCIAFNQYALIYFIFFKYLFVFLLIGCGVLTLLKARGIYFRSRAFSSKKDENKTNSLTKPRLIIGIAYILIGFGILFNYFTYFLIWILDPLPDRLIYRFIDLIEVDPYAINRITDISSAIYPHEKTIYYVFSMFSFGHTVHLVLSIWYLQFEVKNPRKTILWMFSSVSGCILFGFTTFMPFML